MDDTDDDSLARVVNFLYIFIVLICVGISTWASYGGLKVSLGQVAYLGAALIGLTLFAADLGMNDAKRNNRPISRALFIFLFALVFSTASNFNYFYTQYFEAQFSRGNYVTAVNGLERNIRSGQQRLGEDPAIRATEERSSSLSTLTLNLREQVLDPNNPGVGPRAIEIIRQIKAALPEMTDLAFPARAANATQNEEWLKRFEELVDSNLRETVPPELTSYYDLRQDMERTLRFYKERIAQFQTATGADSALAVTLIENMASKTSEYEARVNRIVGAPDWVAPVQLRASDARLGEIVETFKSVFTQSGDFGVAIWSLVLSLFIDLIPLIYALTLVRPTNPSRKRRNSLRT